MYKNLIKNGDKFNIHVLNKYNNQYYIRKISIYLYKYDINKTNRRSLILYRKHI